MANEAANQARLKAKAVRGAREEFRASASTLDPYWKQGDASLHNDELWAQRMDLSTHSLVTDELHNWWVMLRRSFAKAEALHTFDGLSESMYGKVQLRLYKVLISPFDPTDARKCARENLARVNR